jgi:hypothetical protein
MPVKDLEDELLKSEKLRTREIGHLRLTRLTASESPRGRDGMKYLQNY